MGNADRSRLAELEFKIIVGDTLSSQEHEEFKRLKDESDLKTRQSLIKHGFLDNQGHATQKLINFDEEAWNQMIRDQIQERDGIYYTRLSDFTVGMIVDNLAVGTCKVIAISNTDTRIKLQNPVAVYNCRGWITVEYIGTHLDERPDSAYQRSDPIIGISETGSEPPVSFNYSFRDTKDTSRNWPDPVDAVWKLDQPRFQETCIYCKSLCQLQKTSLKLATTCDPRNGEPMCWDCYYELTDD